MKAADVFAGQVVIQLGLCPVEEVRGHLRELAAQPGSSRDLVNRLSDAGRLDPETVELVRHRVALYEHVMSEDTFVRQLEHRCKIGKEVVADLLLELERSAYRRRLGSELVSARKLPAELDAELAQQVAEVMSGQLGQIVRYHQESDFAQLGQPLVEGSERLEPADFKISALFRSKNTIALVDKKRLAALRGMAEAVPVGGEESPTPEATETLLGDPAQTLVSVEHQNPLPNPQPAVRRSPSARRKLSRSRLDELKEIGDYEVVEVMGSGGMGAVYLCTHVGTGEYCAVKVLLDSAANEIERGRFLREIELTSRVNHPNVIGILDSGATEDGLHYLVVPSLFGKELRHYLRATAGEGLPPDVAMRVFEQLLLALEAVHAQHIVHRDLKPENVFILAGGKHEVRLLDFGVAKLEDEAYAEGAPFATSGREIIGTPAYMSPDAITNDKLDGRTDIYSLGIVLFEMLTGKLPLSSSTPEGYIGQHLVCPPLRLAEARPEREWPDELQELLTGMLAKGKAKRPASCSDILLLLDGGLRDVVCGMPGAAAAATIADLDLSKTRAATGLLGRLLGR